MEEMNNKAKKCLLVIIGIVLLMVPLPVFASEQDSSFLTINTTNETTANVEWRVNYYGERSTYLSAAHQVLQENLNNVEKGIEQLFLQDVQNLQIAEENETLVITFNLIGNYSDSFVTGKYRDLYELGEYAPVGVGVLKIKVPAGRYISTANPGPNEIVGNALIYYDYNWIYPLEIYYSEQFTATQTGEEWKLPTIETISVEDLPPEKQAELGILATPSPISNITYGINDDSKFLIPGYEMYVGTDPVPGTGKNAYEIASDYQPEIYKDTSGTPSPNYSPDAGYYRILRGYDPYAGFDAYLMQYYVYWAYQKCSLKDHKHDYEPIFIWVKNIGEKPYRVAYDRWHWRDVHLHEIHRTDLWSSTPDDKYDMPSDVHTQHKSYFPSGRLQYVKEYGYDIWLHTLSTSLQNNWNGNQVKLNHANCYNTFDVEFPSPIGPKESYSLLPLDDAQLRTWYRILIDDIGQDVMPFKHDVADPFYEVFWEDPELYIGDIYTSINSVTLNGGVLTVDASASYSNPYTPPGGTFFLRGLHKDRFKGHLYSTQLNLISHKETSAGRYELDFDISTVSPGIYTFKLETTDNLDSHSAMDSISINVPGDTAPPTITNIHAEEITLFGVQNVYIKSAITDPSGIDQAHAVYKIPGSTSTSGFLPMQSSITGEYSTDGITGLPGGTDLELGVCAQDKAGNAFCELDDGFQACLQYPPLSLQLQENGSVYNALAAPCDNTGDYGFTVGCTDAEPPPKPSFITVASDGAGVDYDGEYTVSWGAVSDVGCAGLKHYELEETSGSGLKTSYNTTQASYLVIGKGAGTYTYKVRAWDNSDNYGLWSDSKSVSVEQVGGVYPPSVEIYDARVNPNDRSRVLVKAYVTDQDGPSDIPTGGVVAEVYSGDVLKSSGNLEYYETLGKAIGSVTAPSEAGKYKVRVTATDKGGKTGNDEVFFDVPVVPANCAGGADVSPTGKGKGGDFYNRDFRYWLSVEENGSAMEVQEKPSDTGGISPVSNEGIVETDENVKVGNSSIAYIPKNVFQNNSNLVSSMAHLTDFVTAKSMGCDYWCAYDVTPTFKPGETVWAVAGINAPAGLYAKMKWYDPSGHYFGYCGWYLTSDSSSWPANCNFILSTIGEYRLEFYFGTDWYDDSTFWLAETETFTVKYHLDDHKMTTSYQTTEPYDPTGVTSSFNPTDEKAEAWLMLDDLAQGMNVAWDWYDPAGAHYTGNNSDVKAPTSDYWDYYYSSMPLCINGQEPANRPGQWRVEVRVDGGHIYSDYFTIADQSPPNITVFHSPAQPNNLENTYINVDASDYGLLDTVTLYWKKDNGAWNTKTWRMSSRGLSEVEDLGKLGYSTTVQYYAVANDTSGNSIQTSTYSFTVGDKIGPSLYISKPANGEMINISTVAVEWSGSDPDVGIGYYEVLLDTGNWTNIGTSTGYTYYNVGDGLHTVYVRAVDRVGNPNVVSNSFLVDTVPPPVPTPAANPSSWTSQNYVTVSWEGVKDDRSGVARYEYQIDSTSGAWTGVGTSTSFNTPALTSGEHVVYVRAVDNAGNAGDVSSVMAYIDVTPPDAPSPAGPTGGTNDVTPTIFWDPVNDTHSGIAGYEYAIDYPWPWRWHNLGDVLSFETPALTEGVHHIHVRAYDKVGNRGNRGTAVVDIDLTSPSITEMVHSPAYPTKYDDVTISAYISDAHDIRDVFVKYTADNWTTTNTLKITKTTAQEVELHPSIYKKSKGAAFYNMEGKVVVKYKKGKKPTELLKGLKAGVLEDVEEIDTVVVEADDADRFLKEVKKHPDVLHAQKAVIYKALMAPSDPYYADQWNMKNIYAEQGWNHSLGQNVVIAIIDTGVDYTHVDLDDNVMLGRDWVNGDDDPMDDSGHGTHVAGIAAAEMNGVGVVGVAPNSRILAEKVLDANGIGYDYHVAEAIIHAVDSGADVITLSLGGGYSKVIDDACNYAYGKGVLLVAAAGNGGEVLYPAALNSVIAVSALNSDDTPSDYSSAGPEIELSAPGGGDRLIYSTHPGDSYEGKAGTSMAAPHVSGVIALIKSLYPDASNEKIRDYLHSTAIDLGPAGRDENYGFGIVNAGEIAGSIGKPGEQRESVYSDDKLELVVSVLDVTDSNAGIRVLLRAKEKMENIHVRDEISSSFSIVDVSADRGKVKLTDSAAGVLVLDWKIGHMKPDETHELILRGEGQGCIDEGAYIEAKMGKERYRSGATSPLCMNRELMSVQESGTFSANIGKFSANEVVQYYIVAEDVVGNQRSNAEDEKSFYVLSERVVAPTSRCTEGDFYYDTIGAAVDDAWERDTIIICPGTYTENIKVNKRLNITGLDPSTTIIKPQNTDDHVIEVTKSNVELSRITVKDSKSIDPRDGYAGIYLYGVTDTTISDTIITNNHFGIWMWDSHRNTVSHSKVMNNHWGFLLFYTSWNNIIESEIGFNSIGIFLRHGGRSGSNYGTSIINNTIYSSPSGISVEGHISEYYIASSWYTIIEGNTIRDSNNAIVQGPACRSGQIRYNVIENADTAISLSSSHGNRITYNNITGSSRGISVDGDYWWGGGNRINNNNILDSDSYGLLVNTERNIIENNRIENSGTALSLGGYGEENTVSYNNITGSALGIRLGETSNYNKIYHNNIIENTVQAEDSGTANSWDDGYPSGGNYWSDWTDPDMNGDGVVDYPYVVGNGKDRSPVTVPNGWLYIKPDTAPLEIYVTSPENETYFTSQIDIKVGANKHVRYWWYSLDSRKNVSFAPNTTITVPEGTHNLTVYAEDPVGNLKAVTVNFTIRLEITVCKSGCDFQTIQEGINEARGGNIVRILDQETYYEKILLSWKNNITLDCDGSTIVGGVSIYRGKDNAIKNCIISSPVSEYTTLISVGYSSGNSLVNNTLDGGPKKWSSGVYMYGSNNNNTISGGLIKDLNTGISVGSETNYNTISNVNLSNNGQVAISIGGFNNTISENNFDSNDYATEIRGYGNLIVNNTFSNNNLTVWLFESSDYNRIFHNNFIDNCHDIIRDKCEHAFDWGMYNSLDDGYPSGGNYWSGWTEPDGNGDGVVDNPYLIDQNQDRYPVTTPNGWLYIVPDFKEPQIIVESPRNRSYSSTTRVLVVTSDEPTGDWWYSLNFGPEFIFAPNTTVEVQEGLNNIVVFANDSVGNTNSTSVWFTVDSSLPTIFISSPIEKFYTVDRVDLNYSVFEDTRWEGYSLDGTPEETLTGNTTLYNLPDGRHSLTLYIEDLRGNLKSKSVDFTVYTQPPNITITSPQSTTYTITNVSLNYTLEGDVDWVGYSINDEDNITLSKENDSFIDGEVKNVTFFDDKTSDFLYLEIPQDARVGSLSFNAQNIQIREGMSTYDATILTDSIELEGITTDGTYLWATRDDPTGYSRDEVRKYQMDGTYTGDSFSLIEDQPRGIVHEGNNLWIVGDSSKTVYKYTKDGVDTGFSFLVESANQVRGITFDGVYLWVIARYGNELHAYKYNTEGSYEGERFSVPYNARDITTDGTYFWVTVSNTYEGATRQNVEVHKYWINGTPTGKTFDLYPKQQYRPWWGITTYGEYLFVSGGYDLTEKSFMVHKYWNRDFESRPIQLSVGVSNAGLGTVTKELDQMPVRIQMDSKVLNEYIRTLPKTNDEYVSIPVKVSADTPSFFEFSNPILKYYNDTILWDLPDGQNVVTVYANDTAGNMNFSSVYFTVDTSPPMLSNLQYSPQIGSDAKETVIKIDAFDISGVDTVWIEKDIAGVPENDTMALEAENTYSYTLQTNWLGNNTFRIWANDSHGNVNSTQEFIIEIQNTITVSITLDDNVVNPEQNVTVTGNAKLWHDSSYWTYVTDNPISVWLNENRLDGTDTWWNPKWQYRIPLTITENSGSDLIDYQMRVSVDTASLIAEGKLKPDCSDTRFADQKEKEIVYWLEGGCNSANTRFWVKVPNVPASSTETIHMYYGNPDASNTSKMWNNMDHLGIQGGMFDYDAFKMMNRLPYSWMYSTYCTVKSNGNVDCNDEESPYYAGGDAVAVDVGGAHICILTSDGNVDCSGDNWYGRANDYTGGDAVAVSAGYYHTCILKSDGNVDCQGPSGGNYNDYGQSQDYTGGDAVGVSAGPFHTCILKSNGNVDCHGINKYGESGDYWGGNAIGVSTGRYFTCILRSDGNVICYGETSWGMANYYSGGDAVGVSAKEWEAIILKSNGNLYRSSYPSGYREIYSNGDAIGISVYTSGDALNQFRKRVSSEPSLSATGEEQKVIPTDADGNYNYTFAPPAESGNYTVKVTIIDQNGIYGENWTSLIVDTSPPNITIISPENTTYALDSIVLNYTVDEAVSWVGYSLDGQANVTLTGNISISGLSDGPHNITIYANDTASNMGFNTIYFEVVPTTLSLSVDNKKPLTGDVITFQGAMFADSVIAGRVVALYKNGESTGLTAITAEDGSYTITYDTAGEHGGLEFYTQFDGDGEYRNSTSQMVSVGVGAWYLSDREDWRGLYSVELADTSAEGDYLTLNKTEQGEYQYSGNATYVFDAGRGASWGAHIFNASVPPRTHISFEWAISDDNINWNWYDGLEGLPSSRYLKQRISLETANSTVTPTLYSSGVYYTPGYRAYLILAVDNKNPEPGELVTFTGSLSSDQASIGGKTVTLYKNGESTGLTATTAEDGSYTITYNTTDDSGGLEFYTEFEGDEVHGASQSNLESIGVNAWFLTSQEDWAAGELVDMPATDDGSLELSIKYKEGFLYIGKREGRTYEIVKTRIDGSENSSVNIGSYPSAIFYDSSTEYLYIKLFENVIRTDIDRTVFEVSDMRLHGYNVYYDASTDYIYLGTYNYIYKFRMEGFEYLSNRLDFGNHIYDMSIDPVTKDIYFADIWENRIGRADLDGHVYETLGAYGQGDYQFHNPVGISHDHTTGDVYIADRYNHRIVKTKMDGSEWTALEGFSYPKDIQYDSNTGYIYVLQSGQVIRTRIDGTEWKVLETPYDETMGLSYDSSSSYPYFAPSGRAIHTFDAGHGKIVDWGTHTYTAEVPTDTSLSFRWATSNDNLTWSDWTHDIAGLDDSRFLKQEVNVRTSNIDSTPVLYNNEITYSTKYETSLTLSVDVKNPQPGDVVNFSGYLFNTATGAEIGDKEITLYKNGEPTGLTAITAEDGSYTITYNTTGDLGGVEFYTKFDGGNVLLGSRSPLESIGIEAWFMTTKEDFEAYSADLAGDILVTDFDGSLELKPRPEISCGPEGKLKWENEYNFRMRHSPVVDSDGTLYLIPLYSDTLYALYPNGTTKWTYSTYSRGLPVIGPDRTVYSVNRGRGPVYAIYPNGTLKWSTGLSGYAIFGTPSVDKDGILYVASYPSLHAIYPNGTQKWEYSGKHFLYQTPSVGIDGTIFLGTYEGDFYAFNPDGTIKWEYFVGGISNGAGIAINKDSVYVYTGEGKLYAFSSTGTLDWEFTGLPSGTASPAIASDGTIYVGNSAIYPNGTLRWTSPDLNAISTSPKIAKDGTIYTNPDGYTINALNPDGSIKWQYKWEYYNPGFYPVDSPTITQDGTIYVANQDSLLAISGCSAPLYTRQDYFNGRVPNYPSIVGHQSPSELIGKATHIYDAGDPVEWTSHSYIAEIPISTNIRFKWTTSNDGSKWGNWTDDFESVMPSRYIKQTTILSSTNPGKSSILRSTTITYTMVDVVPPNISVISPRNITYLTTAVDLNISVDKPADTWWYSINDGENITFIPNRTVDATEGLNRLIVYANDTAGNVNSDSVYFTVDTTITGIFQQEVNTVLIDGGYVAEVDGVDETDSHIILSTGDKPVSGTITITKHNSTPFGTSSDLSIGNNTKTIGKFIKIDESESIKENLSWALIKIYYTQEELDASNISESTLSFIWYNETSGVWMPLEGLDWVYATGINMTDTEPYSGYVWANVSHFSVFGIVGRVDTEPPNITITSPMAVNYSYTENITFGFDATDGISGVASITAYLNGTNVSSGVVIDFFDLAIGEYTLVVEAIDNAGNNATANVTFNVIDDVSPEVNLTYPENDSLVVGEVNITGVTYDRYLDKVSLKIDGIEVSDELPYLWNTYESSGWVHLIELTAVDTSNNSASVNITVFTDNAPPTMDIKAPLGRDYSYTKNITIDFDVTDDLSGVKSYNATLDETEVSNGTAFDLYNFTLGRHTFAVEAVDHAGNYNSTSIAFTVIDDIPPFTGDNVDNEWHATDISVTLTSNDEKSDVAEVHYIINDRPEAIATVDADGVVGDPFIAIAIVDYEHDNNTIEYWGVDEWGNEEEHRFVGGIKLDKTRPETTDDYDGLWRTRDFTINLSAVDPSVQGDPSGTKETYYIIYHDEKPQGVNSLSVDGQPVITYEDDDNRLEYWTIDVAGNEEGRIIRKDIKLDKTPPQTTDDYDGQWHTEDILITLTAIDPAVQGAPSGVLETYYTVYVDEVPQGVKSLSIDGQPVITYEDDDNWLEYWSVDNAGNIENRVLRKGIKLDKTRPATSDDADAEWHTSDITITLTSVDPDVQGMPSGVADTYYIIYEDEVPKGIKSLSTDGQPLITYEDDDNWIEYWGTDVAGNEENHTLRKRIKLDKTPPVVSMGLDPVKDEYFNDEPLPTRYEAYDPVIQGTPSDAVRVIFDIDGEVVEDPTDITNWVGTHTLTVTATDLAGNNASASVTFTVALRAEINIDPDTLNIYSNGNWITAYMEFPVGNYDVMTIDISTVTLNGAVIAENNPKYDFVSDPQPTDEDSDGVPEFMVKFDRSAVCELLSSSDAVTLSVKGEIPEGTFEGSDTIRVIANGNNKTLEGSLKVEKKVKSVEVGGERDKSMAEVNVDLMATGKGSIKAVLVHEYVPKGLAIRNTNCTYAGYGLVCSVGTVEHKEAVAYTLALPKVSEDTTYELRTVVEYQTAEDLETLERTSYLTVTPKGQAKLDTGDEKKTVKAKGKGYDKVHWSLPNSKGSSDDNSNGKKKGHDKDKGKPDKPDKDKDKDKPDKPDNPGGGPDKPPKDEPGNPDNPGGEPGGPPKDEPGNPGKPDNPGNPDKPEKEKPPKDKKK